MCRHVEKDNATDTDARGRCHKPKLTDRKGKTRLRHVTIALAAVTLVGATLIPDDADARGRGGGGARVGAVGGARVGAVGGARVAHVSRPIARPGVGYGRYGRYGYR